MSLVECPECGKQVSNTAITCPNCGFPISSIYGGKLQVFVNLIATKHVDEIKVTFNGTTQNIANNWSCEFQVPSDDKIYTAYISCKKHIYSAEYQVPIKPGEIKRVTITYDNRNLVNRWKCTIFKLS